MPARGSSISFSEKLFYFQSIERVILVTDRTRARTHNPRIETRVSVMGDFFSVFRFLVEILWGEPRQVVRVRRVPVHELR